MNTIGISRLFEKWNINMDEPLGLIFDVDELLCSNKAQIHAAYQMLLDQRGIFPMEGETFPGKDLFGILGSIKSRYDLNASVEDLAFERRGD